MREGDSMGHLFIYTGLSGSGKTRRLKEIKSTLKDPNYAISFDELTKYYYYKKEPKNKFIKQFVSMHPYNINTSKIDWETDQCHIHDAFVKWISTQKGTFYIEGIQFIKPYIDINFLIYHSTNIEIIDMNEIECLKRRIKRCFKSKKKHKLYRLFKYDLNLNHIKEVIQLIKFQDIVTEKFSVIYAKKVMYMINEKDENKKSGV